jgi:ATP phosphoribosyltransferase regulatory subunit HisZ
MIKSYLEFKQAEEAIKLAEEVLMRKLSDDEKEMIIVRDFKSLMESLEVSQDDWKMLKEVKEVIAAYTSSDEDKFIETVKNSPNARELFEFILDTYEAVNDIEEEQEELCSNPYAETAPAKATDPVADIVERMKNGETIELDNEMMNKVCEHLAENFMNYLFQSINGKSSLKVN